MDEEVVFSIESVTFYTVAVNLTLSYYWTRFAKITRLSTAVQQLALAQMMLMVIILVLILAIKLNQPQFPQ